MSRGAIGATLLACTHHFTFTSPPSSTRSARRERAMSNARTIGGAIGAGVGVVLALGGGAAIAVDGHQRDRDGYFSTKTTDVRADGYAITSTDLGIDGVDGDVTRALA